MSVRKTSDARRIVDARLPAFGAAHACASAIPGIAQVRGIARVYARNRPGGGGGAAAARLRASWPAFAPLIAPV